MKGSYMGYEWDDSQPETKITVSSPSSRFDLEQQIMDCWNIVTDLDTVSEGIKHEEMTVEKVETMINGLRELYTLKFEKCFNTFEAVIRNGEL